MTATNHYLVGVASAAVLKNPLLALPVAFASHFVLDALPHFGLKYSEKRGKILMTIAVVDTFLVIAGVILTLRYYPAWYILAGLVTISPDFVWIYRFTIKEKFGKLPPSPSNAFNTWHSNIQKFESTWGGIVEILVIVLLGLAIF